MKHANPPMLRRPRFWFSLSVYERIRASVGSVPAETGGMLGCDAGRNVVSHFFLDADAARTPVTYTPDIMSVNTVLDQWDAAGVRLAGFVHSHPKCSPEPSAGDRNYAVRILSTNPESKFLLLPIVLSAADASEFSMRLFVAKRDGDGVAIQRAQLLVFEDAPVELASPQASAPAKQEASGKPVATVPFSAHRCGRNVPIPAGFPFPCLHPGEKLPQQ
jgi:proteasome lid subunit RPN8/RPN11